MVTIWLVSSGTGNMCVVGSPLNRPLRMTISCLVPKRQSQHGHKKRRAALDEHPAKVFEMFEKGFYSATFDLLVFGSNFFVAFRHDSG
jgi:hypothetical protein